MSNDIAKISVIGTGKMGFFHSRLLSRLGLLDSIVDTNLKVAKRIGTQFKVPYFTSIEELSTNRKPNGAIIAVPTNLHSEITIKAVQNLDNLKSLLIEKPLASSVLEAEKLASQIKETDLKVIIGHIEVYNPIITRIQEILQKRIIGTPRSILFQRRGAIAEAKLESIGDIYVDVGVHDFDVALRLFPRNKYKIYSSALRLNNTDNSSVIVVNSEVDDFIITFLMSREYAGKLRKIEIEGTKATLFANLLTQILELRSLEISRGEKDTSAIRIPFSSGEQVKVYGEPLLYEIWNLVDCIRGTNTPFVSISDGIKALKFVEAARKSIKTHKPIYLTIK